jgi:hypothetical protein
MRALRFVTQARIAGFVRGGRLQNAIGRGVARGKAGRSKRDPTEGTDPARLLSGETGGIGKKPRVGQITKSLSSPSRKNILLSFSRKSAA